jgi:Zinc knuckle
MAAPGDGPLVPPVPPVPLFIGNVTGAVDLVPTFSGSDTSVSIADFIDYIESAAGIASWNDAQQLGVARIKLTGQAKAYVKSHPEIKALQVWEEFKGALIRKYQPSQPGVYADYHFRSSMQEPDETIDDFATRLRERGEATVVPPRTPEEKVYSDLVLDKDLLNYFLNGIRHSLKPFVFTHKPTTFAAAVLIAKDEEHNAKMLSKNRRGLYAVGSLGEKPAPYDHDKYSPPSYQPRQQVHFGYPTDAHSSRQAMQEHHGGQGRPSDANATRGRGYSGGPRVQQPARMDAQPGRVVECYNCGAFGHRRADCTRPYRPICQGCGCRGHVLRDCRKTGNQAPNGTSSTPAPQAVDFRRARY